MSGKPQGPTHRRLQDSTSKWLFHSGHGDPLPSGSCPQQPGDGQQVAWGDWRVLVSGTQLTLLLAITLPGQEPWEDRPQTCSSPESNSTAPKSSAVSSQQPSFCSHTHLLLSGAPSTALRRLSSHQPGCETNLAFPSASQTPSTHERPLKCATLTLIIFTIIY